MKIKVLKCATIWYNYSMGKLRHGRTCVYNVNYHIVWSTKYRRKVLNEIIEKRLKEIINTVAKEKGFETVAELDVSTLKSLPEVRDMCAVNTCGQYGKRWSCPPGCGEISECLREGRMEDLMEAFTAFLGDIDYRAEQKLKAASYEEHFQYTFYLIMKMLSCYEPLIEKCSSRGRCDMVVETPEYVYIFEFKLNGTADEALAQIESQGYAEPYLNDPRQVIRLGVAFSQELQNISEWKMV